jgi:hypothetical protein
MAEEGFSIKTGDVSGTGIAIGKNVRQSVAINQGTQHELLDLVQQLQAEIQKAQIPDGAKSVLLTKAIPEMNQAAQSDDPKSGFKQSLERIDDQLNGVGATADHVSGIINTVTNIAKLIGIPLLHLMPYLAALI